MSWTLQERARLDFVLVGRRAWAGEVYPALVNSAGCGEVAGDGSPSSEPPADWEERTARVAPSVHGSPVYPFFAFLERNLQKQLWRTLVDACARSETDRCAAADAPHRPERPGTGAGPATSSGARSTAPSPAGGGGGRLELDPELLLPDWYRDTDFHLQPGGVWQGAANAEVYRSGAQVVMLGANNAWEFHRRFVATAVPRREYHRIVDLGCGFGKSTFPFKEAFPAADVVGVDLAAPVLEMAHDDAERLQLPVTFRQADAADTGLEERTADLVSATMLVHELPPAELRRVIAEAARLLEPGGLLRVLDFHPTGDPVLDLALVEHSERNNEPYLRDLFRSDVLAWCAEEGFLDARWVAFDERGDGRLDAALWPCRREWHFPWAVLEATRA